MLGKFVRMLFATGCVATVIPPHGADAADGASTPQFSASAILGVSSDYVYRGVSLNDQSPTPLLMIDAAYGAVYFNGLLVGTELGTDALGRSLGELEADATIGFAPTLGPVDFNIGAKYTGYPTGRDLVFGTLTPAERDFVEVFAGGKIKVGPSLKVGGTVYWTPDFYYETGEVTTLEASSSLELPVVFGINARLTGAAGRVRSEYQNIVSPGSGYDYHNVGIEGQFEAIVFDVRYWGTDVEAFDVFDERVVAAIGVKLPP